MRLAGSVLLTLAYSKGVAADQEPSDDELCAESTGQVYVRASKYKKHFAIMYSWYMPRDATWTEHIHNGAGHRHEGESAIVWLKNDKPMQSLLAFRCLPMGKSRTTKGTR